MIIVYIYFCIEFSFDYYLLKAMNFLIYIYLQLTKFSSIMVNLES